MSVMQQACLPLCLSKDGGDGGRKVGNTLLFFSGRSRARHQLIRLSTALLDVSYQGSHRSQLSAQWTIAFSNGLCS